MLLKRKTKQNTAPAGASIDNWIAGVANALTELGVELKSHGLTDSAWIVLVAAEAVAGDAKTLREQEKTMGRN
jgi:hypothetical protein